MPLVSIDPLLREEGPPPEKPMSLWAKTKLTLAVVIGCWAIYVFSGWLSAEAERRAEERRIAIERQILALTQQCEAHPKACAVKIHNLMVELSNTKAALKKEKDAPGVGTGYILGKLI